MRFRWANCTSFSNVGLRCISSNSDKMRCSIEGLKSIRLKLKRRVSVYWLGKYLIIFSMNFTTPTAYMSSWEFSDFDELYEQQNMPKLIAAGWPVNWNYVSVDNVCAVWVAVVRRTLHIDSWELFERSHDTMRNIKNKVLWLLPPIWNQETKKLETTTRKA